MDKNVKDNCILCGQCINFRLGNDYDYCGLTAVPCEASDEACKNAKGASKNKLKSKMNSN